MGAYSQDVAFSRARLKIIINYTLQPPGVTCSCYHVPCAYFLGEIIVFQRLVLIGGRISTLKNESNQYI